MSKVSFILPAILASFAPPFVAFVYCLIIGLLTGQPAESLGSTLFYVGIFSFGISVLSVIFLGMPMILILQRFGLLEWWSTVGSGFFLAAALAGIFLFPRYPKGATSISGNVITVSDGVVTMAGWYSYLEGVISMGGFGAIAALAFWCGWRKTSNVRFHT